MVFGGIPYYLNFIDPQRSLAGSIDFALFNPNGPLYDEYNNLFPAMFRRSENYVKVVNALSTNQYGMTRNEIIQSTNMTSGEGITRVLNNLERCGFIRKYSPLGTKEKYYQLIDFYVLFYHRFLKDRHKVSANFWTTMQSVCQRSQTTRTLTNNQSNRRISLARRHKNKEAGVLRHRLPLQKNISYRIRIPLRLYTAPPRRI